MPDKEKVIEGLKCHYEGLKSSCDICPYKDEWACQISLCGDALALLKEQEAVEPKEAKFETFGSTRKCSNCNKYLFPAGRYCPHCSRPVRWDE